MIFLARYLAVADMGTYGLLLAVLTLAVYCVGLDFYTFANRRLLRNDGGQWRAYLRSQFTFYLNMHLLALPAIASLIPMNVVPVEVALWTILLLPVEHIGQELDRVLIAMGEQVVASACTFVRHALTPIVVVPLIVAIPSLRDLDFVLATWWTCNFLGVCLASLAVRRRLANLPRSPVKVSWSWIRLGIRACLPFLVGTVVLKALFTVDRGILQAYAGLGALGVYTVYMAVGNGMTSIVSVGVHQFLYPGLVQAAHAGDDLAFRRGVRSLLRQTVGVVAAVIAAAALGMPVLLAAIDRAEYRESAWMLWWVLFAMALYCLSLIPHLVLYSLDADAAILWTSLLAFACFAVTVALIVPTDPKIGVLMGIGVACGSLLISKGMFAWRVFRRASGAWRLPLAQSS